MHLPVHSYPCISLHHWLTHTQEVNFMGHVVTTQAMLPMLRASALKAKTRQGSPGAGVPGPSIVMVREGWLVSFDYLHDSHMHKCGSAVISDLACHTKISVLLVCVQVNSFAARIPLKNMGAYTAAKVRAVLLACVRKQKLIVSVSAPQIPNFKIAAHNFICLLLSTVRVGRLHRCAEG